MKMQATVFAAGILIATAAGCSMSQATTRGQSHGHNVQVVPPMAGNVHRVQNAVHDQRDFATQASYHSTTGFPGYSGFAGCPSGHCRSGGCPSGRCGYGCGHGCGHHCQCPHHYHSWSYERPGNLAYPDPGAVGGAVVYPYYTHKGPSDFFRDDCSVLDK